MNGGNVSLVGPIIALVILVLSLAPPSASNAELSGFIGAELRLFPYRALESSQDHTANWSLVAQPEFYHEWEGRQSFAFVPFFRWDQHDNDRTHFDVRELTWLYAADTWELRLGVRKVFWGVTEALHLVDIINQTDFVENVDTEDKLGQPMVNLALIQDWGTVDLFLLTGFRKRTFAGKDGRLRFQPRVDSDRAEFQSGAEERHIDAAIRWSHVIGDWDIGLAHFYGTSREPTFRLGSDGGGSPVLIPRYDLIHQTSLDLQATKGDWLWKLEALVRSGQGAAFFATTGGLEYTYIGVFETPVDIGVIGEYIHDDRPGELPTPFDNDIVTGLRVALNDAQSTETLITAAFDVDGDGRFFNIEAHRRIGASWKLELEGRFFEDIPADDPFFSLRDDDYLQLTLSRFF